MVHVMVRLGLNWSSTEFAIEYNFCICNLPIEINGNKRSWSFSDSCHSSMQDTSAAQMVESKAHNVLWKLHPGKMFFTRILRDFLQI